MIRQHKKLLRSIRHKLKVRGMKATACAAVIRAKCPTAPTMPTIYDLFEWYLSRRTLNSTNGPAFWSRLQADDLRRQKIAGAAPHTDDFLRSYTWRRLRMEVIKERGAKCECCGATPTDGQTVINVDHIKPRKRFPTLALDKTNLQVLCETCNHGKGNWDETDWREPTPATVQTPKITVIKAQARFPAAFSTDMRPRLVSKKGNYIHDSLGGLK